MILLRDSAFCAISSEPDRFIFIHNLEKSKYNHFSNLKLTLSNIPTIFSDFQDNALTKLYDFSMYHICLYGHVLMRSLTSALSGPKNMSYFAYASREILC